MKITYDPRYNIAYIRLRDKSCNIETLHISDELNIDISPDGKVYGFELLNAKEQLKNMFVVKNEQTHQEFSLPFAQAQ